MLKIKYPAKLEILLIIQVNIEVQHIVYVILKKNTLRNCRNFSQWVLIRISCYYKRASRRI